MFSYEVEEDLLGQPVHYNQSEFQNHLNSGELILLERSILTPRYNTNTFLQLLTTSPDRWKLLHYEN